SEIVASDRYKVAFSNSVATLEICGAHAKDSGLYYCECTAANEVGSCTCKTTLSLKGRVIVLGKMAEFQCAVTGSPTFSVQWQKDDSWIMEDPKMERTFENNVATLRIPACEAMHSGRYTCQVSNEAGQDKCSASLIVQGKLSTSRHAGNIRLLCPDLLQNIWFPPHCCGVAERWEQNIQWGQTQTHSAGQLCVRRNRTAREIRRWNLLVQTDQFSWKL
uniref:Ig-like domain-containing protein n=1 Tax=Oryzias latipes TaxID=8090 RepID=A0A3P9J275_ORYLA